MCQAGCKTLLTPSLTQLSRLVYFVLLTLLHNNQCDMVVHLMKSVVVKASVDLLRHTLVQKQGIYDQSCQISSQSYLKQRSFGLFSRGHPHEEEEQQQQQDE